MTAALAKAAIRTAALAAFDPLQRAWVVSLGVV
jgi:hypothetical protein